MSIIINPEWTFIEALQAAWKAYSGGVELGAPNRVRCLERWANVVGRERAVYELNAVLSEYATYKEAAKSFGMSVSTLSRIRKNFNAMPSATLFSTVPSKIEEHIASLKKTENNIDDIDQSLEKFLQLAKQDSIDPIARMMEVLVNQDIESSIQEQTLRQVLAIVERAGINVISRLFDWITNIANIEDIINTLENLEIDDLQKLNAAIGLGNLKSILSIWQVNQENNSEEFWQQTLAQNSFVFAQIFSFPVIIVGNKAYLGGKNFGNTGGNIVDFLCANSLTKDAALIEIKTPQTRLLGSQYRGDVYNISNDLSGSVIQIANYKKSLLQNYTSLIGDQEERFDVFNPKTIVIIGNAQIELTESRKRKSFELFRSGLSDIQIITYDELFGKVEFLVALLQGEIVNHIG
ncbi:Shedu immune nuclease family protein [Pseudanabaena minima]|uniref:Shedu immune nuclease family protein n=1 Tax=Pseudanabaena minima TaxID=890415 RepID=UPI003DA871CE